MGNRTLGLKRCGKSCRLRWMNYLSPTVKRGDFSEEEDDLIIRLHKLLGNRYVYLFIQTITSLKFVFSFTHRLVGIVLIYTVYIIGEKEYYDCIL